MNADPKDHQHGGEALQAAEYAKGGQPAPAASRSNGSAQIASVVLPFLEQAKSRLGNTDHRLDFGVRKFDVVTGENWSAYFRVVNTRMHKASLSYIIDLSSRSPLILVADSLDVGSTGRRREVWDETIESHNDVTDQVLAKLLDRAVQEAGQP
jgi:hypothetical protein